MNRPYRPFYLWWLLAALGTSLGFGACRDVMPGIPFGEYDTATYSDSDGGSSDQWIDAGGYPDSDSATAGTTDEETDTGHSPDAGIDGGDDANVLGSMPCGEVTCPMGESYPLSPLCAG